MRICPTCKTAYTAAGTQSTCPRDGTPLVDAAQHAAERGDPLIGTTLAGRFKIAARIGTGGMGTVYRAEQAGLGRQVALKVLKRELVVERETVARFHREAKAMSMLLHPNTVRVFDFGEDPRTGHLFLAMELLEGKLLTAHLENEGALDVLDAIGITQEVLRSLHEAHTKGIVHRDLKPDNIFLATIEGHAAPVVKVLDFGIAKVFREEGKIDQLETQAGTVFGTPRYMSPEQAQGKALDPRSDLYSVGVLLYHLLTGHPPFVDEDAVVVMAKHIRERAQAPRKAAPDRPIPASLDRVVMRAMEKDASDRFSGADAFEQALAACVHDSIAAKSALETGRRSDLGARVGGIPRGPLVFAAALVGLALITSAAMIVSAGWSDAGEAGETVTLLPGPTNGAGATTGTISAVPSAPTPATRTIVVDSDPTGAEVWRGDALVGATPQTLEIAADEQGTLELRLEGHQRTTLELASAAPAQTITLAPMRRIARRGGERRGGHEEVEVTPTVVATPTPTPAITPDPPQARDPYERFE